LYWDIKRKLINLTIYEWDSNSDSGNCNYRSHNGNLGNDNDCNYNDDEAIIMVLSDDNDDDDDDDDDDTYS